MSSTSNQNRPGSTMSAAFLGSPTQSYIAGCKTTWKHIDPGAAKTPAFLGSPTQHYSRGRLANQAASVATSVRRFLLKMGRPQSKPSQSRKPTAAARPQI